MAPLASMFARVAYAASKRQSFRCAQHTRRRFCTHSSSVGNEENLYNEFFYDEKHLESDEALWALYHRWCKHHEMRRDHDDMVRRFDEFKSCAHEVHRVNNSSQDLQLSLNEYSDIPVSEMYRSTPIVSEEAHAWFKAMAKAVGGGSFEIEPGPADEDGVVQWVMVTKADDDLVWSESMVDKVRANRDQHQSTQSLLGN